MLIDLELRKFKVKLSALKFKDFSYIPARLTKLGNDDRNGTGEKKKREEEKIIIIIIIKNKRKVKNKRSYQASGIKVILSTKKQREQIFLSKSVKCA